MRSLALTLIQNLQNIQCNSLWCNSAVQDVYEKFIVHELVHTDSISPILSLCYVIVRSFKDF